MKNRHNNRIRIHCPLCLQGRIADAAIGTDFSRLKLYGPLQEDKAQLFLKCPKCGQQIGISMI